MTTGALIVAVVALLLAGHEYRKRRKATDDMLAEFRHRMKLREELDKQIAMVATLKLSDEKRKASMAEFQRLAEQACRLESLAVPVFCKRLPAPSPDVPWVRKLMWKPNAGIMLALAGRNVESELPGDWTGAPKSQ